MDDSSYIRRYTELSANLLAFCRFLRSRKFTIGPSEEKNALEALQLIPWPNPDTFQAILRASLARSKSQFLQFPELYKEYWKHVDKAVDSKVKTDPIEKDQAKPPKPPQAAHSLENLKNWLHGKPGDEEREQATYSSHVQGNHFSPDVYNDQDVAELRQFIRSLVRRLAKRNARRRQSTRARKQWDVKQMMRRNLKRGGELVEMAYQKPKPHRLKLLLVCDVSKSMELYSQFLIQLMYAGQTGFARTETFGFSTQLFRLSEWLEEKDLGNALKNISDHVSGWSGGTRIGYSLSQLLRKYGPGMIDRKTVVIILSDGWDTGEIDLLAQAMKTIQRRSQLSIWINPLAGNPNFKPEVRGMQAALPYVDMFTSGHNTESFKEMLKSLNFRKRGFKPFHNF